MATGDTAGAVTGGQAGKNAVENNALGKKKKPVPIYDIRPSVLKPGVLDENGERSLAGGGIGKAGKGSPLPTPAATTAKNGLNYQSNPKHTPGQQGYSYKAGTEPKNSIDLFGSSVVSGKKRYAKDVDGNVHQFTNTNDGTWHWSGSTGDKSVALDKNTIPPDVKKQLDLPKKGW